MAVLAQEPCVFPPDLMTSQSLDQTEGRRWLTVYTKSRQEKALARDLAAYEIPHYLPVAPYERMVRGRRMRTYAPLFPGYLFLFGSEDERLQMLCTNRVSRILSVPDGNQLYRDLQGVMALVESGAPLSVEKRIDKGHRVRVKSGSLLGMEGTVIQRRGVDQLLIAVNYLQQGVSIQIVDFMVEPI